MGSLHFVSFVWPVLKDASASDVSFVSFKYPQTFAHIQIHEKQLVKNEMALSLPNVYVTRDEAMFSVVLL